MAMQLQAVVAFVLIFSCNTARIIRLANVHYCGRSLKFVRPKVECKRRLGEYCFRCCIHAISMYNFCKF
jgi:hypothetical protein